MDNLQTLFCLHGNFKYMSVCTSLKQQRACVYTCAWGNRSVRQHFTVYWCCFVPEDEQLCPVPHIKHPCVFLVCILQCMWMLACDCFFFPLCHCHWGMVVIVFDLEVDIYRFMESRMEGQRGECKRFTLSLSVSFYCMYPFLWWDREVRVWQTFTLTPLLLGYTQQPLTKRAIWRCHLALCQPLVGILDCFSVRQINRL